MERDQERQAQETIINMEEFPRQRQRNFDQNNEEGDHLEVNMRRVQSSNWVIFVVMIFLWIICILLLIFTILVGAQVIKCEIQ